jgi:hypothetical protein
MLPKIFIEFYDHLLSVIEEGSLTYEQLDAKLKEIGAQLLQKINSDLKKYGVGVEEFIITQFVKPEELKKRVNELAAENEKFNTTLLNAHRKITIMQKQSDIESQAMKIELDRAEHLAALAKISAESKSEIEKISAESKLEIEKMDYETKGVTYKELRKMDREDLKTLADAEAKVAKALKVQPQDTVVVIKKESRGKCPYCDGEITQQDIFCPTCKNKVI